MCEKLAEGLSAELREVLVPLFKEIESLNERINEYDERMEKIAKQVYPEVSLLKQVKSVGTQIALTYVLTIEEPYRFPKSRIFENHIHIAGFELLNGFSLVLIGRVNVTARHLDRGVSE